MRLKLRHMTWLTQLADQLAGKVQQYGPYTEKNFRLILDQTDKKFHTETNTGS